MIAVVIVLKREHVWEIDTWLQSCRILERGVEQALMNLLFESAKCEGVACIRSVYIPTEKNRMVSEFYDKFHFRRVSTPGAHATEYYCDAADYRSLPSSSRVTSRLGEAVLPEGRLVSAAAPDPNRPMAARA